MSFKPKTGLHDREVVVLAFCSGALRRETTTRFVLMHIENARAE
jgi:hypothetical protein